MLLRRDGILLNLGSKCSIPVQSGVSFIESRKCFAPQKLVTNFGCHVKDTFKLMTPGGGGYGRAEDAGSSDGKVVAQNPSKFVERGSVYEFRSMQESA